MVEGWEQGYGSIAWKQGQLVTFTFKFIITVLHLHSLGSTQLLLLAVVEPENHADFFFFFFFFFLHACRIMLGQEECTLELLAHATFDKFLVVSKDYYPQYNTIAITDK